MTVAGLVPSWIAANWNGKTAAISAVATTTGLAVVYLWKSDAFRRYYANKLTKCSYCYDSAMANRKRQVLAELESVKATRGNGRLVILEIGCANGASLKYYPVGSEVICVEPNPHYRAALYETAQQLPGVQISAFLISSAENMREVESESVDAVVSVAVLCSVDNPDQCLREIMRVLKPGGRLLFLEHVKAPDQFYVIRFVQFLLDLFRVWRAMFDGCRLSRDTENSIRKSGFSAVDIETFEAEFGDGGMFRLIRTHISGAATK